MDTSTDPSPGPGLQAPEPLSSQPAPSQAASPPSQQPAPSQAASPPSQQAAPQQSGRAKLSTGTRWAIGLAAGFLILVLGSCIWASALFSGGTSGAYGNGVALIHIDGAIAGTGSYVTPEDILGQLDQALEDPDVGAIILRIDSPGGTVAASQEISMAVKRAAEEKPIVASIGDMGASGAYMVASQCTEIVAAPGSSVGSIGVIMEIPDVESLLATVGVEFTVLKTGEYKDTGSYLRGVTPTEAEMLEAQMQVAYKQFIADVAEGRGMTEDEVGKLATGWVWLGAEAQTLGLVDKLGNYDDAVTEAAALGGIEGKPTIVSYEYRDPISEFLRSMFGVVAGSQLYDAESLERESLMR